MTDKLEEVQRRASAVGYHCECTDVALDGRVQRRLIMTLPRTDDDPPPVLSVWEDDAEVLLQSAFDDYRVLEDFEAIWSPTVGVIECGLDPGSPRVPAFFALENLARRLGLDAGRSGGGFDDDFKIAVPSPREGVAISMRACSREFAILRQMFGRRPPPRWDRLPRLPVLRIEGLYAPTAQVAADWLERVGNALLFQVDLRTNVPVFLSRPTVALLQPAPPDRGEAPILKAPSYEYDPEPMSLYFYGRTAFQIPLLRFLAYYQVAEYYFPIFSEARVREGIQRILKDPRFDVTKPTDIGRLIEQVRPHRSGRGFGDERTQLQATIQECVSPEEMRMFIEGDDRMKRFYDRPSGKRMPVVPIRLPIGAKDADVRPQVAERLYEVRCRIVHTKASDAASDRILIPFSREANLIRFDTAIMEFIARQVLVATSRPLHLDP